MSYFLKKSYTSKGVYYQVYDVVYDKLSKNTEHKSIAVIGFHDKLLKQGISDSLAYAKQIVSDMEIERKKSLEEFEVASIFDDDFIINAGSFLPNAMLEKFFKCKTDKAYFDCINYYFEIDKPMDDRQAGHSKENRRPPIIGMELLLDRFQIPLSMLMYSGNLSEKTVLRKIIDSMKSSNNIIGETIQVADKGLNCGQNIFEATMGGDGYIYSQSVKKLSDVEKNWVLNDYGYESIYDSDVCKFKIKSCVDGFSYAFTFDDKKMKHSFKQKRVVYWSKDWDDKHLREIDSIVDKALNLAKCRVKKKEYGECSKYINFGTIDEEGEVTFKDVHTFLNYKKTEEDKKLCGYNMLISSELNISKREIYDVYHNLWRIEQSFRILKSSLQARPVYLQKKERIYGHFLVCFTALLILRY